MDFENAQLQGGRLDEALLIKLAYRFLLKHNESPRYSRGLPGYASSDSLSAVSRSILAQRCFVGRGIFIKRNLVTLDLAV